MAEQKQIALCISGSMQGIHDEIIRGAFECCKASDIRLLLYSSLLEDEDYHPEGELMLAYGESMPFQLIPFDEIDGLIIAGRTLHAEAVTKELVRRARTRSLPVISIDDDVTTGCFHVNVDDEDGMEQMVRHIVEEHGLTRVNFIGGAPGNPETENRLRAYKRVLQENNIPLDEERIGYGQFGKETKSVLERFFDGKRERPQAIVCANDRMAIQTVRFLVDRDYRVPEDIVVTGFDGTAEALNCCPTITTVRRGMCEAGELAVKMMQRIWKNRPASLDTTVKPGIIYNQSCGCQPMNLRQTFKMYDFLNDKNVRMEQFVEILNSLLHYASQQKSLDGYLRTIQYSTEKFHIHKMVFCMADRAFTHVPETPEEYIHYPEQMRIAAAFGVKELVGTSITPGAVPEALWGDEVACVSFVPIYYRDHTLGYLMMGHRDMDFNRVLFKQWLSVVSAQLGVYYEKEMNH